jgi:succinate dehydrogenase / fumarate reductase flavoprotein subunit
LRNKDGERFMERYAPVIKDLAPRDMVSRCILEEVRAGRGIDGKDFVNLDLTHLGKDVIGTKLSEIIEFARTYVGVDASKEPIPVQPTCHYMMGGIATDSDACVLKDPKGGNFSGLYAAGECACVSVHGANRLGCNSLLDTLVFGRRAGKAMARYIHSVGWARIPEDLAREAIRSFSGIVSRPGSERIGPILAKMQATMMTHVSVYRQQQGLETALADIRELKERYQKVVVTDKGTCYNRELLDYCELGYMLDLAEIIALTALWREESRGAHFREDFPRRDDGRFLAHSLAVWEKQAVPRLSTRPVAITRFQPKERTY